MIGKEKLAQLSQVYSKGNLEKGIFPFVKKFYFSTLFESQNNAAVESVLQKLLFKKPLNATETVLLSFSVFENENIYKAFLATLPKPLQTLIEKLLWIEGITDTEAEKLLNEPITAPPKYSYTQDKELKNEFYFFSVNVQYIYTYPRTAIYTLFIHPLLKQLLMEYYPKPAFYYFIPLDEIPETSFRFTAEKLVMHEMPKLLSYYMQGAIKYSTKGKPTDATLNKLQRTCGLTEFLPGDETLGKIRNMLMAGLLYDFKISNINIDTVSVIKDLFTKHYLRLYTSQFMLAHLKGWAYMDDSDFNENTEHNFLEVLKQLPPAKWVSVENLAGFIQSRFIQLKPVNNWALGNRLFFEKNVKSMNHTYTEKKYVGAKVNELVLDPFIKGTIFLWASFGLIEIACTGVNTQEFGNTFYSGYDGLQYFRVTALGAYILGFSASYETTEAQQQNKLAFSEDSLMILAEGEMGVLDVMLSNFAEKAGNNRYNVTHAHFLKDCRNRKDIENKITLFKKTISSKLPVYWEQQFLQWKNNALKINADHQIKAFKIPPDAKELHRLIAQDAALKSLILKAEQFYILVPVGNETKFKNRMKELGYLVE